MQGIHRYSLSFVRSKMPPRHSRALTRKPPGD
ncbi:hypothetical protein SeGA_3369, partial [Salmonella enterica subsp. enterica serovar Gaminara str. A4-567]